MRKSKVKAKLRNGEFARMSAMGHFLPFFVRHSAHFGYDGIWLDLEHRTIDEREVQSLLALCHYNDIDCMLRPKTLERAQLYHYLEDGATGFMIPFVSDVATAEHVVRATKFPPLGNRGLDGAGLDSDYILGSSRPGSTYIADSNSETFIVAQIETPEAVANADGIAAVEGIDCLFIGPGDLGLRLSAQPEADRMTMNEAIEQVSAAAKKHGKAWGITAGTIEDLDRFRKLGAQIVPFGSDFALMRVLQTSSEQLNSILGS